jgi:hypothetical protein
MVVLTFQNPEDINPNTGMVIFDKQRIPYNGCYQVTKVVSKFQDGLFTQRLQLLRVPGQPVLSSGRSGSGPASATIFSDLSLPNNATSSAEA